MFNKNKPPPRAGVAVWAQDQKQFIFIFPTKNSFFHHTWTKNSLNCFMSQTTHIQPAYYCFLSCCRREKLPIKLFYVPLQKPAKSHVHDVINANQFYQNLAKSAIVFPTLRTAARKKGDSKHMTMTSRVVQRALERHEGLLWNFYYYVILNMLYYFCL